LIICHKLLNYEIAWIAVIEWFNRLKSLKTSPVTKSENSALGQACGNTAPFFDYLAQRLPPERYAAAFARVIELHAIRENEPAGWNRSLENSAALSWRYSADHEGAVAVSN
jgi:hypothetical protein